MCFCESDAVNVSIHVRARQRYPGIKFHEETLRKVAREFNIRSTLEVRAMSVAQLAQLADAVLKELPASACPIEYRDEAAIA